MNARLLALLLTAAVGLTGAALRAGENPPPPPTVPASCSAILLAGDSVGDGVYAIDPEQDSSPINVYCDMTTDGGGWTLAGYGANSNLGGKLNVANGVYNPINRTGSANINALALAQGSTEVSLSWSNSAANAGLGSYTEAVSFAIPNPSSQTLNPSFQTGHNCVSPNYTQVTVEPLVGAPNLPAQMYTRTDSLGAVYGGAYGLVLNSGNSQCDWYIDGQSFRAAYLGIGPVFGLPASYWSGVVYNPGGSANHVTPSTMAIWFRGQISNALPGLVAHYTFDGNDGTDSSGNGHHGTLMGSPAFTAGPAGFGNAMVADIGKFVTLPNATALSLYNHSFTVTAWVNASAFSGLGSGGYGGDWALLGGGSPGFNGLHLVLREGRPYMGFYNNDLGSGSLLSLNTWYHVAWRYNTAGGEMALFLNGVQISSGGGHSAFTGTGPTFIGRCCESWDYPRYAKGRIDDVQIYDRPLTGTEIASLMNSPAPQDSTPPAITPSVSGTLGGNLWYVSDVTVSWSVVDDESDATETGCSAQFITSDTAGTTITCSATSDGGSASESVTIKRDATPPSISGAASPTANGGGWNNTSVAVTFSCADGGSGIASCNGDTTLAVEGAGQSANGSAADMAGNTAAATVGGINIDKTPPAIAIASPSGGVYTLGQSATASFTCTDALSGIASCTGSTANGGALDTATVGSKSVTVNSADNADNTASASASYTVVYAFGGFRQPIPAPVSTFKAGSTIPVKFTLSNASGAPVTTALATVSVNGGSPLGVAVWDGEQYHFNLKTKGLPAGPLTIAVKTDDGQVHAVTVTLKP